jgi:glycosyltransferase involved in cell wall biosynthesis
MKILLIGNYTHSQQQSMQRFADLMRELLTAAGHEVRLLKPEPLLGNLKPGEVGLGKWLGYIDRFILFRWRLHRAARWADVVHVCDHGNAMYVGMLGGKPNVVTCHDLLAVQSALGVFSGVVTGFSGRIFQRWILAGLCHAQHVVCVSEQTRSELQRLSSLPDGRCCVVPNALNYPYRPIEVDAARERLRSLGAIDPWPFFVHVGGNQWYKNRAGVVRLFMQLAALPQFQAHHLILAGKPWTDDLRSLVRGSGLAARIHEWTEVNNEDLRALYSTAEALLFPSLQEGFGWPIAEAQACGCPVVTTNRAPMTEVGGDASVYIDPGDMVGAAALIANALNRRQALVSAGLRNAGRFTGATMAAGYVAAYRCVLSD